MHSPRPRSVTPPSTAGYSGTPLVRKLGIGPGAREFGLAAQAITMNGALWIGWPKKASKVPTDLTENRVRDIGLAHGLVDVKVCAVTDVWSGLKFVRRLADRE